MLMICAKGRYLMVMNGGWMHTCFRLGTIKEYWKRIQESKWYDPVFEDFINKEIVGYVEREIR
jgi:hypothetical protein